MYKVVLTGGPCAGKTTTVARLETFFQSLGWKVYTVPEAATILLGRVKFPEMSHEQVLSFQRNILKTILQLESTFFELAEEDRDKNVLIVCDRGTMDPSAFCTEEEWALIMKQCGYDIIQLRDARYNQVIHMMTAANGAESFYQLDNNPTRSEGLALARELDGKAATAWVGHPYYYTVDNSTDFEKKILRVIALICKYIGKQLGVDINERLQAKSKKRKFLVRYLPDIKEFPKVQDFDVQHDYLLSSNPQTQTRIRKRGQNEIFTYTHTERTKISNERVERIAQVNFREYQTLYRQRDSDHHPIYKTRRCFLSRGHYYQLDIYKEPWNKRCQNLVLLETYTTKEEEELELPGFLDIVKEVTDNPHYSMYYLSAEEANIQ